MQAFKSIRKGCNTHGEPAPKACTPKVVSTSKQVQPQHATACRSILFFAFMCLSALLFSLSDDHALLPC